mmetsp:Transcript_10128/g.21226  ORF Transcript_10128/g.21226 Transcript_10128/m.21226 type:complete len:165 (+) Transcript_10128:125-619(+)
MKRGFQSVWARPTSCRPSQLFRVSIKNLLNDEHHEVPISKTSRPHSSRRRRRLFTPDEDRLLRERVWVHGAFNWVEHSKFFENRTPGQLRARWAHNLRFESSVVPFSQEEDRIILHLQSQLGNRWAHIAGQLESRSDNAVKNRFHCLQRTLQGTTSSIKTHACA